LTTFAGRSLGQLVHDRDGPRVLVGRDPVLHEGLELVGGRLRAGLEGDGLGDLLAQLRVRAADDRGLAGGGAELVREVGHVLVPEVSRMGGMTSSADWTDTPRR
jgi:hypothetical protein